MALLPKIVNAGLSINNYLILSAGTETGTYSDIKHEALKAALAIVVTVVGHGIAKALNMTFDPKTNFLNPKKNKQNGKKNSEKIDSHERQGQA